MNVNIIQFKLYFTSVFIYLFFISKILGAFPPNYEIALKLFQEKKYEESLNKIREVFDLHRNSLELRLLAASNYIELNKLENALAHLRYALQDHPNSYEVYLLLSEVYNQTNQYQNSILLLTKAFQILKENQEKKIMLYQIAKTYYLAKDWKNAKKSIENLIAIAPDYDLAIYLDGLIYLNQKNYELAEFRFKSLLSLKNLEPELKKRIYNNLGVIRFNSANQFLKDSNDYKESIKEAKEYFMKALNLDPDYEIANQNINLIVK